LFCAYDHSWKGHPEVRGKRITITIDKEVKPESRVLILGVGNLLLKDEGIGVHVARRLANAGLPGDIRVVDCGTRLLDALSLVKNADRLIIIDAVKTGAQPGTIFRLRDKDISESPSRSMSLHQVGLLETLEIADNAIARPATTIIGIEPEDVSPGMELSPTLAGMVPKIVDLVLTEVSCQRD
jgi:hydrogenase maturation protease